MMGASMYSQKPIIQKTTINGENGFIANEVVMDSIMEVHFKFMETLITNETLIITIDFLNKKIEKLNLQVDFLTSDNSRLELQKSSLKDQLSMKDKIHEVDLLYYKEKSKNWIETFLYGTAAGGLIVAIIAIMAK